MGKPVFPNTRKISGLVEAVAIFDGRVIGHDHTRGEACHWILGRFAPYESSSLATARNDGEWVAEYTVKPFSV